MDNNLIKMLKKNTILIILIGILFSAAAFSLMMITEKKYKVSMDFIVVQNQVSDQDLYSFSRSMEYIINVLSASVYSGDFIGRVIEDGSTSSEFNALSRKDQVEEWSRTLQVHEDIKLGTMNLEIYGDTRGEVGDIARSVANIISKEKYLFENNDDVKIRILSGSMIDVEKNPSVEKIIGVVVGGFFLSIGIFLIVIYYAQQIKESKRDRNFGNLMKNKSHNSMKL